MNIDQTTATTPAMIDRADWNNTYRRTLRLGRMLLMSLFVALLVPTDSHFLGGMSIGYAVGIFLGYWLFEYATHHLHLNHYLIWPELAEQQEAA